jgi:hypothetical protein
MPSNNRYVTRSEYNRFVDLVEGMQDMMANIDYRLTGLEEFKELENRIVAPPMYSRNRAKSPQVGSLERRLNALRVRRGGTNRRVSNKRKTRRKR